MTFEMFKKYLLRLAGSGALGIFFALFGYVATAQAAVHVTGTVTDQSGAGVQNVTVSATDVGGTTLQADPVSTVGTTGSYDLVLDLPGTYDIHFTPSSGSGLNPIVVGGYSAFTDQVLSVQLLPTTHTVSGTITDNFGHPVSNIRVFFNPVGGDGVEAAYTTGLDGHYSFQAQQGTYAFRLKAVSGDLNGAVRPFQFTLDFGQTYSVGSSDITQDFQLHTASLTVNTPNPGATVAAFVAENHPSTTPTSILADGSDQTYGTMTDFADADTSGSVTLTVFKGFTFAGGSSPSTTTSAICVYTTTSFCNSAPVVVTGNTTIVLRIDLPPSISTLTNVSLNEGGTLTQNGTFSDSDSTTWTATVNYGDGSGVQPLALSGTSFTLSHVYRNEGTNTVTVSVTDNQGAISTAAATVTVSNTAPSVGAITDPATIRKGVSFAASAPFTDPGVLDTHTASWNWGDGNSTSGTVTESNGSGNVSGSHTYANAGSYTITLTVTDNVGATGTKTFVVAVSPAGTFKGTNLSGSNYSYADLSGQDISGSNLQNGTFNYTSFIAAVLTGMNATNASFQNANFTNANLAGSNFTGSNFTGANFTGANLHGANFSAAIMTGVIWSNTICPDNTNSNSHGNTCIGHGGGL
jgi:hypothetical protein